MLRDIRLVLRTLARRPMYSAMVLLVLALGIGSTTAVFSVVDAAVFRPLPFPEPDRLAVVWTTNERSGDVRGLVSPADYFDWMDEAGCFERIGAYTEAFFNLTGDGEPERVTGAIASSSLFNTLGVAPIAGRTFLPAEDQGSVAILGEAIWRRRYGGARDVIGRTILVDDVPRTVVGILPAHINGKRVDVYTPFDPTAEVRNNRNARFLTVVGRLASGISAEQAQRAMDIVTRAIAERHPSVNAGRGARVVLLHDELTGTSRPAFLSLLAAVGLVLALACANVASLLLARVEGRRAELAVRAALGAGRLQLARLLLAESLVLALAGGAFGAAIAWIGVDTLAAFAPADIPRREMIHVDARVLAFAIVIAVVAGTLAGLIPALLASRQDAGDALRSAGRGASPASANALSVFVVLEVALSVVLLVGAGLFVRSFARLGAVDPGFSAEGVIAADVTLPARYGDASAHAAFLTQALERLRTIPGVRYAGATSHLPLSGEDGRRSFRLDRENTAEEKPTSEFRRISPGYFEAMGIPLVHGRSFDSHDDADAPGVVLVNQAFVGRFLNGQDPLGKVLVVDDGPPRPRQIVGVVGDVKHFDLGTEARPELYVSYFDRTWPSMTLVVRGTGAPADIVRGIRGEISNIDDALPLTNVKTLGAYVEASIAPRLFGASVLVAFACTALLLTSFGLYGVLSFTVAARTREIGVRLALGAKPNAVVRLVVSKGMLLTSIGLVLGFAVALALSRFVSALLFGVSALDPATYAGVGLLLFGVAFLACSVPARRSARIDPMLALRSD
jgi:putative ABC transport system permease protein